MASRIFHKSLDSFKTSSPGVCSTYFVQKIFQQFFLLKPESFLQHKPWRIAWNIVFYDQKVKHWLSTVSRAQSTSNFKILGLQVVIRLYLYIRLHIYSVKARIDAEEERGSWSFCLFLGRGWFSMYGTR